MYLYDTNTISELRKKQPHPNVVKFNEFVNHHRYTVWFSVLTYGEVLDGIGRLQKRGDWQQAAGIQAWFDKVLKPIEHLALDFDIRCAKQWGSLMAINPQNPVDKQLAATAIVHDLILVTRNVKHIADTGVKFINPFESTENYQ